MIDLKKIVLCLLLSLVMLTGCSNSYRNIDASEAKNQININQAVLIDVRSELEFNQGHIEGAINIPLDNLTTDITSRIETKTPVIVYCQSGNRSKTAAEKLVEYGYKDVFNLGSIDNWK